MAHFWSYLGGFVTDLDKITLLKVAHERAASFKPNFVQIGYETAEIAPELPNFFMCRFCFIARQYYRSNLFSS